MATLSPRGCACGLVVVVVVVVAVAVVVGGLISPSAPSKIDARKASCGA